MIGSFRTHLGPLAFFGALTLAWTWPLTLHLTTAVPGGGAGGDNLVYLWDLWWMRHVLDTPGAAFFHTDHLLFPFGTTLVNHPHMALPAFVAVTLLGPLSIITAQNILLLASVFLNGVVAYGLAWDLTRHRRTAILAGVLFGTSPYLAAHLLGHFDLTAAWVLPAFAWALRRALVGRSTLAAVVAGLVLVATAYTAYYYVVYLALFAVTYTLSWAECLSLLNRPRINPSARVLVRRTLMVLFLAAAALAGWIVVTGGTTLGMGGMNVSLRRPQNLLTLMWLAALVWWVLGRHLRLNVVRPPEGRLGRGALTAAIVTSVFVAGAFPLLRAAVGLKRAGEYVSQPYFWRSAPKGVDAVAPFLGHPFHSLFGDLASRAYAAIQADRTETVAWIGLVPLVVLLAGRVAPADRAEARRWWAVGIVFAVWAVGPMLRVAGADIGLWMPEVLVRYIPLVENARMPGRAMVGVYLAIALLAAMRLRAATGRWQRPAVQSLLIAGLVVEYADMPIPLTALTRPAVFERLGAEPSGGVCNLPFGLGDGFGYTGADDFSVMYDATIHGQPLVGGFIGRLPKQTAERYAAMPVVRDLLKLSGGGGIVPAALPADTPSPCTYLVVKRAALTSEMRQYLLGAPFEKIDADEERDVYRARR